MKQPVIIGDVLINLAADKNDAFGRILRQCPFIQKELIKQGKLTFQELSDDEQDRLLEVAFQEEWLPEKQALIILNISTLTLHGLMFDKYIDSTKIKGEYFYKKIDIQRILENNHGAIRGNKHD